MRYAIVKDNRICAISENSFHNQDSPVLEIPGYLSDVSSKELIINGKIKNGKIYYKQINKSIKDIKIALVGNWKMKCGISTYSENLWPEIIKYVGDYKLFIENNNNPTGPLNKMGDEIILENKVVPCWTRGESLKKLIDELKDYDPDIILIQHEYGLWPNACRWLSLMNQLSDYRVIVIMHSIFHHRDKTICEAAIPEIVVHLQGAHDLLKYEKQIPGKVYVIPHGCFPCSNKEKLWNFYKSEHTIIQAGFLFRYKGWEDIIKAVHILKNKYSDVFFTGLCSESDYNKAEHQIYYNELMNLINKLNLQDNVALIRGYQSDQTWDSYFRTNKVAVFPYITEPGHDVFGASGAARLAMTKYLPVISSEANHFSDLPTIKAQSATGIAKEIDKLFSNPKLVEEQLKKQVNFLEENSWAQIAKKYIELFQK